MKIRGQKIIPLDERIKSLSIINPETNCWEWRSATNGKGYGKLIIGSRTDSTRRSVMAHRLSYETFIGKIPDGCFICHKCDNPSCVNPEHLFAGTRQDNIDDREEKNRNDISGITTSGENHPLSKLSWKDVAYIRANISQRGDVMKLAKRFGVNHKTISDIKNFKTWIPDPPEGE